MQSHVFFSPFPSIEVCLSFVLQMIIRNMETHSASVFKCNDWFSKTEGKLVKEIPAETDGEEMLKSKLFSALFNGNTLN